MGWLSDAADFGSDLFDKGSSAVGSAWEWGSKNQAALGAVAGVGRGVLSYMTAKDAPVPGQQDREYMEQRRKEHNESIAAAAKRFKEGK
jgi:hypothetical protein